MPPTVAIAKKGNVDRSFTVGRRKVKKKSYASYWEAAALASFYFLAWHRQEAVILVSDLAQMVLNFVSRAATSSGFFCCWRSVSARP